MRLNYAIIFVSDMSRSVSFYQDVLGLPLKFQSPGWSEFITGEATLALHRAESESTSGENQIGENAGSCRPGLAVADLNELHARMLKNNVRCLQEPKEVFGARIAQYLDPDGLTISVAEERKNK